MLGLSRSWGCIEGNWPVYLLSRSGESVEPSRSFGLFLEDIVACPIDDIETMFAMSVLVVCDRIDMMTAGRAVPGLHLYLSPPPFPQPNPMQCHPPQLVPTIK